MKNWKTLNSIIVHRNPWYHIQKDDVIRPDGTHGEYFLLITGGASVFIVAQDGNKILLIGQERYTNKSFSWEVPGGNSDGQDPLTAAKRELWEETGYEADVWEEIGFSYTMNGVSTEKSYIFRATELIQKGDDERKEEGITEMKWVTLEEAKNMIKTGDITDNQTITAITKVYLVADQT